MDPTHYNYASCGCDALIIMEPLERLKYIAPQVLYTGDVHIIPIDPEPLKSGHTEMRERKQYEMFTYTHKHTRTQYMYIAQCTMCVFCTCRQDDNSCAYMHVISAVNATCLSCVLHHSAELQQSFLDGSVSLVELVDSQWLVGMRPAAGTESTCGHADVFES